MSNQTDEQKMDITAKAITAFAENENIPPYLRWGLQVLFVAGSDSTERSNAVAGLASVGERAFNQMIATLKAKGDLAGAKKLESDKINMLKMALAVDFAGALAHVFKSKMEELKTDDKDATENVIVGIQSPAQGVVLPTAQKDNPFAGRN